MSTVKSNTLQLGQSLTASQNFCWYQPSSPDGTVRLGNGNAGSVTDLVTVNSSGNVGIGTSSPGYKLEVAYGSTSDALVITGSVDNTTPYLSFKASNGGSSYIRGRVRGTAPDSTAGGLAFDTGASGSMSEKMRLDSSGNLGLGVTPSAWFANSRVLQITTGVSIEGRTNDGTTVQVGANYYLDSAATYRYLTTNYAQRYTQAAGYHYWFTAPSGTAGNAISFTQAMTLDASGNLLVGTTSTSGYGNFANALQSATVSANSTAKSWDSTYRVASVNASTVDVWFCRDAAGNVRGTNTTTGHFYVYVVGVDGGNAFSAIYSLVSTGNGTSQATLALVSSVTRGTSPVSTVTIANDGVGGAIKLQITYINNSGVVTGGYSNVVFKGLII